MIENGRFDVINVQPLNKLDSFALAKEQAIFLRCPSRAYAAIRMQADESEFFNNLPGAITDYPELETKRAKLNWTSKLLHAFTAAGKVC